MFRTISLFVTVTLSCFFSYSQTGFTVSKDPKDTSVLVFKGMLSDALLQSEPSFNWYKSGKEAYTPNQDNISLLQHADSTLHFIVFGGTWCDDTQFILPRFMKWIQAASFPNERLMLFGVDRDKKTIGNFSGAFQITRVPTIIVMKNGKEAGRIVEYGKTGVWDKELAGFIQ